MKRIAISIALVAVVVSVVVVSRSHDDRATTAAPSSQPSTVVLPIAQASRLALGVEHTYDVSTVQSGRNSAATEPELTVALDGTLAVAYAGTDAQGFVFRAQLTSGMPRAKRGGKDASPALEEALARPYYFTTTQEGRLIAMRFAPDTNKVARGTLTQLASLLQVSTGSGAAWDAVESDSVGDYDAHYARNTGGMHRERVRYRHVAAGKMVAATIVSTGTDIALRTDGWPEQIAGTEVTRVGVETLSYMIEARFTLRHAGVKVGVAPGWPEDLQAVAVATTGEVNQLRADQELVDGATLADLLGELARAGDDAHARGYLFLRMAALFRLDPESVRAAKRGVLDHTMDAPVVVAALGEAGTPVAQDALVDFLGTAALSEDEREHAAMSLGFAPAPTPGTLTALAAAARGEGDIASTATLAQGAAALNLSDDDPSAAAREVDGLLDRLARATDDHERALVLRALGNTGDPRIVPALQRELTSSSFLVRIAATEALRLVPGVDGLIVARFGDADAQVREAAVFAASERGLVGFIAGFAQLVHADPSVEVRRAIVELAGARINELPGLREIVEYAAAHDRDADVRDVAKQLLVAASA